MTNKIKTRESNIELLRIISIILIICFHYVYKSNFLYTELNINTLFIKNMWFFGELGVNLFILITGYYMLKNKVSLKKIILLIFQIFFYNFLLYSIGYFIGYNSFELNIFLIFPIITSKYWFATAYLLVYILSPFFNKLINSLKKTEYKKFIIINLIIWSIIPTVFGFFYNSSETLLFYNRFIWLCFMYFIGAYIRKYNIKFFESKKKCILVSLITFLMMMMTIIVLYVFRDYFTKVGTTEIAYFWTPNNILMFVLSISTFIFFTKLKIKPCKVINKFASTTLGIYLLHDGQLTAYMWQNIFHSNINIYSNDWFIHVGIATFLIFLLGFLIDSLRQIIEKYTIKKLMNLKFWKTKNNNLKLKIQAIIDKLL